MLIKFCLLAILLISLIYLSASDEFHPRSNSSYGNGHHYFPASTHDHCHYSNSHQSPFANDSSICLSMASEKKSDSIQYHTLDKYANDFTQAMLSIPDLKRFLHRNISVSSTKRVFYKLDYELLKEVGNPKPKHLAKTVVESLGMFDDFPLSVYFKVTGYTVGRFLLAENIELGHNSVTCYSYLVEVAMQSNCIDSVMDLYKALLDAFLNFTTSLGFTFLEKSDFVFHTFNGELHKLLEKQSHPPTNKHKHNLHHT